MDIKPGYEQTEVGVIPEDWDVKMLGELTNIDSDNLSSSTSPDYEFNYISLEDVESGTLKQYSLQQYYLAPSRARRRLTYGDVMVSTVRPNLKSHLLFRHRDGHWVCSTGFSVISCINQSLLPEYVFYHLFSSVINSQIECLITGSNYPAINSKEVRALVLPIPSLREQEAIANVLSNVDGLIEGLQKLIDKKRLMKQGAMQRLLNPYENGQLKEGWEVKKLGDIAQVGRGRVISHKEINLAVEGKYPVYSSQTSNNGVMGYIDSFDFDGEYITWTTDGVNAGKVFYRNGKFNRTNVCGTIKLLGENAVFVALMLGTITPKYVAKNLANPKLMNEPVKKIDIALPPLEEQEAIATTLSDMDTEIEALDKKLAKYRQIKQGMMQELLTGKTRLVEPNIVREASANAEDQTWGEQQLIKMNSYSATRHQC